MTENDLLIYERLEKLPQAEYHGELKKIVEYNEFIQKYIAVIHKNGLVECLNVGIHSDFCLVCPHKDCIDTKVKISKQEQAEINDLHDYVNKNLASKEVAKILKENHKYENYEQKQLKQIEKSEKMKNEKMMSKYKNSPAKTEGYIPIGTFVKNDFTLTTAGVKKNKKKWINTTTTEILRGDEN